MTHSGPQTSGLQPSGLQTASLPATITSGGGAVRRAPPPPLRWRHWPIEEGGPSAWLLSLVMLGATGMVGWETGSATWALAACGLVAAAAWRYFVPVYYELNARDGASRGDRSGGRKFAAMACFSPAALVCWLRCAGSTCPGAVIERKSWDWSHIIFGNSRRLSSREAARLKTRCKVMTAVMLLLFQLQSATQQHALFVEMHDEIPISSAKALES
jgi:hypothetical protein